MRFDIVTLFPELFAPHLALGVTRRAFGPGAIDVRLWQLRDFADDAYRRVDDRPYGGGPGMVMLVEPLIRSIAAVQAERRDAAPVIHFTPTGRPLDQAFVEEIGRGAGAVLVCGRYEGIDQRFVERCVTHEVSLGDFVLSGGEIPALALLDSVARRREGVIKAPSQREESFADGLLEAPTYSRPEVVTIAGAALAVPEVLLSGHHAQIARWRRERSLELTARRRPDLIALSRAAGRLSADDERFLASLPL